MFDLNIKCLGAKLHYLRTHWGSPTQEGRHLQQMYEAFLMDIGLGGNIFDRNYESLQYLAENSWFKHLWRLCHQFDCKLEISFPAHIQEQREGDKALMDIFLDSKLFSKEKLMVLQRTRRFKKVHFLSDCLCMDGRTVHPSMLTKLEGRSTREFSIERPTRGMVDTWKLALISITSSRYTRESPLGCFLVHPHNNAD